jgi:hypothetical protein
MNTPPLLQRCQWCGQDWWDTHICPKLSPTLTAYAPAAVKVSNTSALPPLMGPLATAPGPVRYQRIMPTQEQRTAALASHLSNIGDCVLVWVNEGDLYRAAPPPAADAVSITDEMIDRALDTWWGCAPPSAGYDSTERNDMRDAIAAALAARGA